MTYTLTQLEEKGAKSIGDVAYLWSERNAFNRDDVVVFTVLYRNYEEYWGVEERASCANADCIYDHLGASPKELVACIGDA